MWADSLLPRIAEHLELRVIAPLAGGEFGATLVTDRDGREMVLKAVPSTAFAARWARGSELAMRMRSRGYPAPEYFGTGVALGAGWSLQQRLPGAVPETMTRAHASRMIELARTHAGAADAPGSSRPWLIREDDARLASARSHDHTRALASELSIVFDRCADAPLLDDGVMHGDFHHKNYLAIGEEVTGVFDWEFADAGDWRFDLATLAFATAPLRDRLPESADLAMAAARDACPPDVLALFFAYLTTSRFDFYIRVHPEYVPAFAEDIEKMIAPVWRAVL